jgi:YD repeat-containing protein
MKFFKGILFSSALILLIGTSFAGVNLKNGNFYISYTDLILTGTGPKIELTRTYNSKSLEKGWFGFGWGSFFETKLVVSPEGSIIIHEHGAGGMTRFVPQGGKMNVKQSIANLISSVKKNTQMTDSAAKALTKKLQNAEFRHSYARQYGFVTKTKAGQKWVSSQRGSQTLQRFKDHYVRATQDGRKDHFDLNGNMIKVVEASGHKVDLVYKKNVLKTMKDNFGKQVYFEWYPDGKIKHLWKSKDNMAEYKFKGDDLIYSRDLAKNVYQYGYDKAHNLTRIEYADKSFMAMSYDPKTFFVTSITDRNKNKVEYEYGSDPKKPLDHYWTYVTKKGFSGNKIRNKYEYEIGNRPDGSRYTKRIYTAINGIKTDTSYSECCGKPTRIKRGNIETIFKYTDAGQLLEKKSSTGEFSKLTYDKKLNKIVQVKNNAGTVKYSYDKSGNLTKAISSRGNAVALVYDLKSRISKMIDKNTKTKKTKSLSFKYNSMGKPIVISMDKIGSISVDYDNAGNIKDVKSKQGQKMAVEVTESFQNLLSIVQPAGVDLNI